MLPTQLTAVRIIHHHLADKSERLFQSRCRGERPGPLSWAQAGIDGATYMAIELGAKAGIFPPTGEVVELFEVPDWLEFDPQARAAEQIEVDLTQLAPQIALPHSVDQVVDLSAVAGQAIDVVFLGTCANGRYEDMRQAANILDGRSIAPDARLIVTSASRRELLRALHGPPPGHIGQTKVTSVCPRETATSAAVWVTQLRRFTWPRPASPRPAPFVAGLPTRGICSAAFCIIT